MCQSIEYEFCCNSMNITYVHNQKMYLISAELHCQLFFNLLCLVLYKDNFGYGRFRLNSFSSSPSNICTLLRRANNRLVAKSV